MHVTDKHNTEQSKYTDIKIPNNKTITKNKHFS